RRSRGRRVRRCAEGRGRESACARAGARLLLPGPGRIRESSGHEQSWRGGRGGGMPVKVFVISDMEGVAGLVKWEQTTGGDPMYEEGRRLYTEEINAAVRGARAGGATEIVVMDCHGAGKAWSFNSLVPDLLDPG